ncbi:hypothetical protein [Phormidesmis priestleyi]
MNADTFDRPSSPCPVCHQMGGLQSVKMVNGLLTCPHCRQRLVVSMSGHYVRDPFSPKKQKVTEKMLRRQSRPLARILRDSGVSKHSQLLALLGSLVLLGFSMAVVGGVASQQISLQGVLNQIDQMGEAPQTPPDLFELPARGRTP